MSDSELRLALIGWGAIGRRVATLLAERDAPVRIVAVGVRDGAANRAGLPAGSKIVTNPAEIADLALDLVVEAASRDSVGPWARAVLTRGVDVAISSVSAFVDEALLAELVTIARKNRAQILLPPGALGGIDALAAAARLPMTEVRHEIIKPATAWAGTKAEMLCDLASLTAPFVLFDGSAREAAGAYPQNANVAAISALAGIGLDRTRVTLVADPDAVRNSHRITASGDFGALEIRLENRALATNPKSSEMTALSLVRLIENRASPLVF